MLEVNLKPEDNTETDPLADDPIPTYNQWLDAAAAVIFNHWGFHIAKGAIETVKYLWTRERLLIELLLQKGVIQQHEVDEFFGDKAHENCSKEGVKQLTRALMRASSQGKLVSPDGDAVDPDTVLVVLNDILDLNNTGWTGHTLEVISDMFNKRDLKGDYAIEVKTIENKNKVRALRRKQREQQKELEVRQRVEREHDVCIYVSKCRVAEKPVPTSDEQRQMVEGKIPIPKVA